MIEVYFKVGFKIRFEINYRSYENLKYEFLRTIWQIALLFYIIKSNLDNEREMSLFWISCFFKMKSRQLWGQSKFFQDYFLILQLIYLNSASLKIFFNLTNFHRYHQMFDFIFDRLSPLFSVKIIWVRTCAFIGRFLEAILIRSKDSRRFGKNTPNSKHKKNFNGFFESQNFYNYRVKIKWGSA